MIEVKGLTKSYGDLSAIENLDFTVGKGDVVGFLGPNGAGKSTTMKIITGFMAPSSGVARIAGFDVFENPIEVKKRIGYLPETPPLFGDMYVKDYLRYVAKLKDVPVNKFNQLVDRAIDKTNLQEVQHRLLQNLSKGFKQRVGIAQALVSDPEVLILDEPTVGLDPIQVAEIRDLIKELKGQHTIILSTHILPEVQATCEKVIIIHRGRIVAQDTLAGLEHKMETTHKVKLIVRTKNDIQSILSQISGVENVRCVSAGELGQEFEIETKADQAVIDTIAGRVLEGKYGLNEISHSRVSLEDIFIQLTNEKGA